MVASSQRLSVHEKSSLLRIARVMTGRDLDELSFLQDAEQLFFTLETFHKQDLRKALRVAAGRLGGLMVFRSPRTLESLDLPQRIDRFDRMRRSPLVSVRKVYAGLLRISAALHYANPRNFGDVHYPGPPEWKP